MKKNIFALSVILFAATYTCADNFWFSQKAGAGSVVEDGNECK